MNYLRTAWNAPAIPPKPAAEATADDPVSEDVLAFNMLNDARNCGQKKRFPSSGRKTRQGSDEIIRLHNLGKPRAEIVAVTGFSPSWIAKIVKEFEDGKRQ